MIKLSVLKNRLSGILSVGYPSFSVVSGISSVGHPSFSVVLGILSVVGIPPVPISEEIQLLMYDYNIDVLDLWRQYEKKFLLLSQEFKRIFRVQ